MITCPKCSKENQDHYKFCLGCGAELPRDASPKKFGQGTPPQGVPAVRPAAAGATPEDPTLVGPGAQHRPRPSPAAAAPKQAPAAEPPAPAAPAPVLAPIAATPAPAGAAIVCPQCESPNPGTNKFCASCGFKLAKPPAAPAPVQPAPAAAPAPVVPSVVLTALRADGSEAGSYTLPSGPVIIGRDTGSIFAGDSYLSPRHAKFSRKGDKCLVADESSLNGIYRRIRRDEPAPVNNGDVFRVGQEIIRFEALSAMPPTSDGIERLGSPSKGYVGRVALITGRDTTGNAYPIPETGLHLGRERGDVLFPEDGYVSGLHCRVTYDKGQLFLTDLGSSNGTFVRINGETELVDGDILLMGQQLFRINFT